MNIATRLLLCCIALVSTGAMFSSSTGITGTWVARVGGQDAVIMLQERADASLMGLFPGEPTMQILSGSISGSDVSFEIGGEDGGGVISPVVFTGTLSGDVISGDVLIDGALVTVTFNRTSSEFAIEHWYLVDTDTGHTMWLNRVGNPSSSSGSGGSEIPTFRGGGFSTSDCNLIACGGMISDWTISGDDHTIELTIGGDCPGTGTITGTWDSSEQMVSGTWSSTNCAITNSGNFMLGKSGAAYSTDIQSCLAMLANFADNIEAESATAIDSFHPLYINEGTSFSDWNTEFATWFTNYNAIEVELGAIEHVITHNNGEEHIFVRALPQLRTSFEISGIPTSGSTRETIYSFSPSSSFDTELTLLGTYGGNACFIGDGASSTLELELPISTSDPHPDGNVMWPFGVHGGGHPDGHPGYDFFVNTCTIASACAGTVSEIMDNPSWAGQSTVFVEYATGKHVIYDHIDTTTLLVAEGDVLSVGDPIGNPIDKPSIGPTMYMFHLGISSGGDFQSPSEFWSSIAQANFDLLWEDSSWTQEISEPLQVNPLSRTYPSTTTWELVSGTMPARIDIIDLANDSDDYEYEIYDASDTLIESGIADFYHQAYGNASMDLTPTWPASSPTHYCTLNIIGAQMFIDWATTTYPGTLASASEYNFK